MADYGVSLRIAPPRPLTQSLRDFDLVFAASCTGICSGVSPSTPRFHLPNWAQFSGRTRETASRHLGMSHYDLNASPLQPGCPQAHITSVEPLRPSQWALQNFSLFAGTQLHAGFAHFFSSAMRISLPASIAFCGKRRKVRCRLESAGIPPPRPSGT
jgi:hypothetical protein